MPTITINGRQLKADAEQTLLQVAQQNGIDIPTLCNHESLEPHGACRLCLVEVTPRGRSRSRLVVSCAYTVEDGLDVKTETPRITANRRMLVELLLARCSENKVVKSLAAKYGVEKPSFRPEYWEKDDCILCGQCARVCAEVVGVSAISLVNRGVTKWAAPPFFEPAPDCIGCGSCFFVCPTGAVKMEEKEGVRKLINWRRDFPLARCQSCGNYWIPEAQIEHMMKKAELPRDFFDVCITCRK